MRTSMTAEYGGRYERGDENKVEVERSELEVL
jgi:ribosome-binding protein aMBF1 (putative translation factor)